MKTDSVRALIIRKFSLPGHMKRCLFQKGTSIVDHLALFSHLQSFHYANMSAQYTAIFQGCKNDNFQMNFFYIFLIFAQNIDCGYTF